MNGYIEEFQDIMGNLTTEEQNLKCKLKHLIDEAGKFISDTHNLDFGRVRENAVDYYTNKYNDLEKEFGLNNLNECNEAEFYLDYNKLRTMGGFTKEIKNTTNSLNEIKQQKLKESEMIENKKKEFQKHLRSSSKVSKPKNKVTFREYLTNLRNRIRNRSSKYKISSSVKGKELTISGGNKKTQRNKCKFRKNRYKNNRTRKVYKNRH